MTNISDIKVYCKICNGKNIKIIVKNMRIIIKAKLVYEIVSEMKSMYHKIKK